MSEEEIIQQINSNNLEYVKKNVKNFLSYKDELSGKNLLHYVVTSPIWNPEIFKIIFKKKSSLALDPDNDRNSIWHLAVRYGLGSSDKVGMGIERLAWLCSQKDLKEKFDFLAQDRAGNYVLHALASSPPQKGLKQQETDAALCFHFIASKTGTSVHARNLLQETPLHSASLSGNLIIAQLLIENGAKPDVVDMYGNTPLHFAVQSKSPEIVEFLLEKSAYRNFANENNETPLSIAQGLKENGKACFEKLSEKKLSALQNSIRNGKLASVQMFISNSPKQINEIDKNGMTPLHLACCLKNLDIAKYLIEKNPSVDQDNFGNTPLHYLALAQPKINNQDLENFVDAVLKKKKDCLEISNKQGETPLYFATLVGNISLIKIFLSHQAPISSKPNSGETLLHTAVISNSPNVYHLIEQAKVDKSIKHPVYGTAENMANNIGDLNLLMALNLAKKRRVTTLRATSVEQPRKTLPLTTEKASSTRSSTVSTVIESKKSDNNNSNNNEISQNKNPNSGPLPKKKDNEKKEKKSKKSDTPPTALKISAPTNVTKNLHVSHNFEWKGEDPEKMFDLKHKLGEGAYGSVYSAVHRTLSTLKVAIKVVPAGEKPQEVEREMKILESCKNPTIVSYFGSASKADKIWILMEFCNCGSLENLIKSIKKKGKILDENVISSITSQLVRGLHYLHTKTDKKPVIIHRDLKPGNVLLTDKGEAKLADFGVSAQLNSTLGKAQTTIGTPVYMAPEAIDSEKYDTKVDIWGLGILVIELTQLSTPFGNMSVMRVINSIVSNPPPTLDNPKNFSQELNNFISDCLEKNFSKRPSASMIMSHPFLINTMGQENIYVLKAISEFTDYELPELSRQLMNSGNSNNSSPSVTSGGYNSGNSEIMEKLTMKIKSLEDELENQKKMVTLPKDELVNKLTIDLRKEREGREKQNQEMEQLKNEMKSLTLKLQGKSH